MRLFDDWPADFPIKDVQNYIFDYYWELENYGRTPSFDSEDIKRVKSFENYLDYLKTHPYINLRYWDYMTNDPKYHHLNKDERTFPETLYYIANQIGSLGTWPWIPEIGRKEYEGYVPKEVLDIPTRPTPESPIIYETRYNRMVQALEEQRAREKAAEAYKPIQQRNLEINVKTISEQEINQLKDQINAIKSPGYNPYYDLDNTIFNRYR